MINTQDIIFIKNLTFKDTNTHDLKIAGHPALVIHTTEEEIYFLKISSHPPVNGQARQRILEKDKYNKLPKDINYIDITNIYKAKKYGYPIVGYVDDITFEEILDEFYFFQEFSEQDELYNELIEDVLKRTLDKQ